MACSRTFHSIASECNPNMGGIKNIFIVPFQDSIFDVTVNSNGLPDFVGDVESGLGWVKYHFKKNSASFTSTLNVGDGGQYVSTEITMQFNRMETNKRMSIAALAVSDVAMVVEDQNGVYWAFGIDEPLSMTAGSGQTGAAKGDGNFYSITLTDEYQTFPLEITSQSAVGKILTSLEDADITE